MKVLFWGTPDFGLPSLDAMRREGHEIAGIVTNPDRPAGRGRPITASPVKRWAGSFGIPVLQPEKPRGSVFTEAVGALGPDVSVVAAYGQILIDEVLALPPLGSINVHGSLLPLLRGAAPVNWALIRGHEESGATIMRMVRELDAGPVFERRALRLGEAMTAGALYEAIARLGAEALVDVLARIASGTAVETPQDEAAATYAPKLDRATARLDWSLDTREVGRWMRGCDPWPGAWTSLGDEPVQLFSPNLAPSADGDARVTGPVGDTSGETGTILLADPGDGLWIRTGDGAIGVGEVKPSGKRRMTATEWLRGRRGLRGVRLA